AGAPGHLSDDLWREPRVGVDARAGRGATEWKLCGQDRRLGHALPTERDLSRVARELLTQRDRHRVHQVRATGLDDVGELLRLGRERLLQVLQGGLPLVV